MKILSGLYRNIELTQTIDKAFILGYNFDDNGRFITWSKLQKTYDNDLFNRSMRMPLPDTFKEAIFRQRNVDSYMEELFTDFQQLMSGNIESLLTKYEVDPSENRDLVYDKLQLEILIQILKREQEIGNIIVSSNFKSIWDLGLKELIKKHHNTTATDSGIKNYATFLMQEIMNSPKNATSAYKSIDVATVAFSKPISTLQDAHPTNIDDGHSISEGTESGAVGKDDVGIAANGTKAQFSLLQYFNRIFAKDEPLSVEELKDSHYFSVYPVSVTYVDADGNENTWSLNIIMVGDVQIPKGVKRLYRNAIGEDVFVFDRDASLAVGALLSMSADNAKTLHMDKLHALPDIFAMHIFLSMVGCPEDVLVYFANSPQFEELVNYVKDTGGKAISDFFEDNSEDPVFYNMYLIYLAGREVSSLASILSINQGIKVEEEEIVKQSLKISSIYRRSVGKDKEFDTASKGISEYQRQKMEKANQLMIDCQITLEDDFNLYRFLTDPVYAECIKSIYDVIKLNFNIFDVIDRLPHFKKMLLKYIQLQQGYSAVSELFNQEVNKIPLVYRKAMLRKNPKKPSKNQPLYKLLFSSSSNPEAPDYPDFILSPSYNASFAKVGKQVIEQTVLENFIKEEASRSSFKYNNSTDKNRIAYECDFLTDDALHSFMDFMTGVLIPELIRRNPDNRFLEGLFINTQEANKNKNIFYLFEVNLKQLINSDMVGITEYKQIRDAFDKIKDIKISDLMQNSKEFYIASPETTVGDFLYLYDRIAKIVNPRAHDISSLFTDYSSRTYKGKYTRLWKAYDTGKKQLTIRPEVLLTHIAKQDIQYKRKDDEYVKQLEFYDNIDPIVISKIKNKEVVYTKYLLGMPVKKQIDNFIVFSDLFQNALLSGKLVITELEVDCE